MIVHRKAVSVLLILLVTTTGVFALSGCRQPMTAMSDSQPQMLMAEMVPGQTSFMSSRVNACCLSLGQMVPLPLKGVADGEAQVTATAVISASELPEIQRQNTYADAQRAGPPTQPKICVFLI